MEKVDDGSSCTVQFTTRFTRPKHTGEFNHRRKEERTSRKCLFNNSVVPCRQCLEANRWRRDNIRAWNKLEELFMAKSLTNQILLKERFFWIPYGSGVESGVES